jgi:hypothetical protein
LVGSEGQIPSFAEQHERCANPRCSLYWHDSPI